MQKPQLSLQPTDMHLVWTKNKKKKQKKKTTCPAGSHTDKVRQFAKPKEQSVLRTVQGTNPNYDGWKLFLRAWSGVFSVTYSCVGVCFLESMTSLACSCVSLLMCVENETKICSASPRLRPFVLKCMSRHNFSLMKLAGLVSWENVLLQPLLDVSLPCTLLRVWSLGVMLQCPIAI